MAKNVTITLAEAVEEFLQMRAALDYSTATITNDRIHLGRLAREVAGSREIQLKNLTAEHIWGYLYGPKGLRTPHGDNRGRKYQPISAASHNVLLRRFRAFFTYCVFKGWMRVQPITREGGFRPLAEIRKVRQQPAPTVLLELLDAAGNPRDRIWLAACVNTALRQSELKPITLRDLNLDTGRLKVYIGKSKIEDLLPITEDFDAELRQWLIHYEEAMGRPLTPDDLLFPHRAGGMFEYIDGIPQRTAWIYLAKTEMKKTEHVVQKAMAKIGLETRYEGTHTVRRAVARAVFDNEVRTLGYDGAIRTVSALLHHSSSATTERYLGLSSEKQHLDEIMRGKPFLSAMVDKSNVVPIKKRA